jgi:hypothetical protein
MVRPSSTAPGNWTDAGDGRMPSRRVRARDRTMHALEPRSDGDRTGGALRTRERGHSRPSRTCAPSTRSLCQREWSSPWQVDAKDRFGSECEVRPPRRPAWTRLPQNGGRHQIGTGRRLKFGMPGRHRWNPHLTELPNPLTIWHGLRSRELGSDTAECHRH